MEKEEVRTRHTGRKSENVGANAMKLKTLKVAMLATVMLTGLSGQMGTAMADEDVLHLGLTFWFRGETGFKNYKAIEARFDEVNAKGGINGRKVKITAYDAECKPNVGVDNVTKLAYSDQVLLIIGAGCSSVTLPTVPITAKAKVPQITSMSSNKKITEMGSEWIFRTSVSDRFYSLAMGEYIYNTLGARKIAYIYSTDAAANGFTKGVIEYLREKYGLEPVLDEVYQYKSTDLRSQLIKAKAADPDALMLSDQPPGIVLGVRQSYEVGIPRSVTRLHTSAAAVTETAVLAGDLIEGSTFVTTFSADNPDPKIQKFVKWVRDTYGETADHLYAQGDDMAAILISALSKADIKNTPESLAEDRAAIRDALAEESFTGVSAGPIAFCREPTPDCRDGNRTVMVLEYISGGKDYKTRIIEAITVPKS